MDCPDGLARCVDGRVQASRLFSYPAHCSGPPEQCSCPWDNLGSCKRGCVVEGADVVVARDHAWAQLCSPTAADVFSRPPIAPPELPISLCSEATYRCTGDVVVACEMDGATMKPRPLAACLRGCAEDGSAIDDDEGISRDAAIALLCRHGTEAPE